MTRMPGVPGQTLIDVVLADFRKKGSAPGPFAKL